MYKRAQIIYLVQKGTNYIQLDLINFLLPAKTAKATIGKIKKTKFVPKCPKSLMDARKDTLEIILKRCHSLRKKEYKKQEKKVADIIMNADKNAEASYQQQKKALILAVNHLAKLAGPLPSI